MFECPLRFEAGELGVILFYFDMERGLSVIGVTQAAEKLELSI